MKLGFVSAILDGWTFEEMMDTAAGLGYECVEAACWPQGKAERRYAGVSHIDVDNDSRGYVAHIHETCKKTGVEISALAYYPNTMDGDFQKREDAIRHLKKVIAFSEKLGIGMVTTFVGRDRLRAWKKILRHLAGYGLLLSNMLRSTGSESQLKTVRCCLEENSGQGGIICLHHPPFGEKCLI